MEAPEAFLKKQPTNAYSHSQFADKDTPVSAALADAAAGEHFMVEELFDFSNDDGADFFNSADSSAVTVVDSCNSSSFSGCEPNSFLDDSNLPNAHFSDQLCIPEDDLAELEWLSNFVEEPFSSEDIQKLELITGVKVKPDEPSQIRQPTTTHGRNAAAIFKPEIVTVPAKARSKRSRTAPSNWNNAGLLLSLSPTTSSSEPDITAVTTPPPVKRVTPKVASAASKKRDSSEAGLSAVDGRRCMHCATDKTPQWRTGPMGPKTLCNACGVRYKSGRLVPEYRPAASPTFVLTKHSNSHRKVLELRRQKEIVRSQQQPLILDHHHHHHHHHQADIIFDSSNGEDYLIQQSMAHDYRQLL